MTTLRPYQVAAVENTLAEIKEARHHLLCLPCGAGKTNIAIELMRQAIEAGAKRCMFIAHRHELIMQTARRIHADGLPVGVFMAGHDLSNAPVQVASIQTISARKKYPKPDFVIIDEAHLSLAKTYRAVMKDARQAGIAVVGLTATPWRLNPSECFSSLYDRWSVPVQPQELYADRYLMQPEVYDNPEFKSAQEVQKDSTGEYRAVSAIQALRQAGGLATVARTWQQQAHGMKTIAFCQTIEHAEATAEYMTRKTGLRWEVISSRNDRKTNEAIILRFKDPSSDTIGIVNVNMVAEGFDVPDCECVIMFCLTASRNRWVQAGSRNGRIAPNKTRAVLIDSGGHRERLGEIWAPIVPQWWAIDDARQRALQERIDPKPKPAPEPKERLSLDEFINSINGQPSTLGAAQAIAPVADGTYTRADAQLIYHRLPAYAQKTVQRFGAIQIFEGRVIPYRYGNAVNEALYPDAMTAGIAGRRIWEDIAKHELTQQEIDRLKLLKKRSYEEAQRAKAQRA